jgi:hypothetical protein
MPANAPRIVGSINDTPFRKHERVQGRTGSDHQSRSAGAAGWMVADFFARS